MTFPPGCLDVDIQLYVIRLCVIDNMFKIVHENVSRDEINQNGIGVVPFKVKIITIFYS